MVKWVFITLCSFLLSGCFFTKYIPFMGEDERPDLQPSSVSVAGAENDQLTVDVQQSFKNGENAYKAGKYQSARRHYEQALQADPELVDAMFRLGNIELREGKLDKAQLRYKSVIDLQPRNRRAHYNLALVYLIQSENHFKYFMA